jgi:hypothetical protein
MCAPSCSRFPRFCIEINWHALDRITFIYITLFTVQFRAYVCLFVAECSVLDLFVSLSVDSSLYFT